jgi:hypothetical protein
MCLCTWSFWLIGDVGFFGITILGEDTSNKGNHFLNIMSKIGLKYQLSILVLLETGLDIVFFLRSVQRINSTSN